MNTQQRRFCDEYIISGNATQAAIQAGYSPKTARYASQWINERNLQKPTKKFLPEMRDYIDEQLERLHSEKVADAREVIEYMTAVMRGECTDADGSAPTIRDRLKAAELLGKRWGIFTEKVQMTEAVPVVILGDDQLED